MTIDHARAVLAAGWNPIPLPSGSKELALPGITGYRGRYLEASDLDAYDWSGNMALRLVPDVVGVDIDVYNGGDITLAELEAKHGRLPPAPYSTARSDGSRIAFYGVPFGTTLQTKPGKGIEMIQCFHRYAVCAPSIHPILKTLYRFFDGAGEPIDTLPHPGELPALPWGWILGLGTLKGQIARSVTPVEADTFLEAHTESLNPSALQGVFTRYGNAAEGERHDSMYAMLCWWARETAAGWYPAGPSLERLEEWWEGAFGQPGSRRPDEGEFGRAVLSAIAQTLTAEAQAEVAAKRVEGERLKQEEALFGKSSDEDSATSNDNGRRRRLVLSSVSSIELARVRWLWDQRVPHGAITLLGGREGIGKSILAIDLAARTTRGKLEGEWYGQPRPVVIAATEDSYKHTIVPRLIVAGANLDRILRADVTESDGKPGSLVLPQDIEGLTEAMLNIGSPFVLLDPIISRLDAALDTHKDAEVRRGLEPLAEAADRGNFSVLGLIHVNKGTSGDPLTMLMASRAFVSVPRAIMFTTLDPEQPGMRLVGQPKNNLGRTDLPTLMFDIIEQCAGRDAVDGTAVMAGALRWCGISQRSILDAIHEAGRSPEARRAGKEAEDWLKDYLKGTPIAESKDIREAAAEAGHAKRTIERARRDIGAGTTPAGFPRRTIWSAPGVTPEQVARWVMSNMSSGAKESSDDDPS